MGILALPGETLGETLGEWRGQVLWKYRRYAFSNFSEKEDYDGRQTLFQNIWFKFTWFRFKIAWCSMYRFKFPFNKRRSCLAAGGKGYLWSTFISDWLLSKRLYDRILARRQLIRPHLYTLHRYQRVNSPFHGSYCRLLDEAIAAMVAIARSSQRAGRICPPWIQRDAEPGLSGDAIYHLQRAQWRKELLVWRRYLGFCALSAEKDGSNALKSKQKSCWQRHAVQYEADIISLDLPFD